MLTLCLLCSYVYAGLRQYDAYSQSRKVYAATLIMLWLLWHYVYYLVYATSLVFDHSYYPYLPHTMFIMLGPVFYAIIMLV